MEGEESETRAISDRIQIQRRSLLKASGVAAFTDATILGSISDPVEASSAESISESNDTSPVVFFDGLEDGSNERWSIVDGGGIDDPDSNDLITITATDTKSYEGSWSHRVDRNSNMGQENVVRTTGADYKADRASFAWYGTVKTDEGGLKERVHVSDSHEAELFAIRFDKDHPAEPGEGVYLYNNSTKYSYSVGDRWTLIELKNIEYSNNTFDFYINGNLEAKSVTFSDSGVAGINKFIFNSNANNTRLYQDNLVLEKGGGSDTVDLPGAKERVNLAKVIDERSVADLTHAETARRQVKEFKALLSRDNVDVTEVTAAIERIRVGEGFTIRTLAAIGPETPEIDDDGSDLAPRVASLTMSMLVDLAITGIALGAKAAPYLADELGDDTAREIVKTAGSELVDQLFTKVVSVLIGVDYDAGTTAKTESRSIASEVISEIETGASSTAAAITDTIENLSENAEHTLADELQRSLEVDSTGVDDPTVQTSPAPIERGLDNLNLELGPDAVRSSDLGGTESGVTAAFDDGRSEMEAQLTVADRAMTSVEENLKKLDIVENVTELVKAVERGDPLSTVWRLLLTIASLIQKLAGVVSKLFSAQVGITSLNELTEIHYRTLDGIAHGQSTF